MRLALSWPLLAAIKPHAAGRYSLINHLRLASTSASTSTPASSTPDEKELVQARSWLKTFTQHKIPRNIGEFVFSRSSGPGGQNVNKVNSKATLRIPVRKLEAFVPPLFIKGLKRNPRYLANNDTEVVISSDSTRSQATNVDDCYQKLYDAIVSSTTIPGETSDAQKERVKKLSQSYNEKRLKEKRKASNKKASRKGGFGDY
ncbi:hypothetical protein Dda_4670 [Drechslerella dactyloides]|uniref:Prokaryotic-type class I peptide chain release factors domain-containing protein n=1 Tax=Drechslerella dactyloides TaxID=74499 RepID=A0AAD6IXC5_DREDA|nr:hypothetical protein Dda_4670 [Drechslerella dactyloides]